MPRKIFVMAGLVICLATGSATGPAGSTPQPGPARAPETAGAQSRPRAPFRAAFYYPWFPENWTEAGFDPFTNYTPTRGYYDLDLAVAKEHVAEMRYGRIEVGIASWWGQGTATDGRFPLLLQAAADTPFRWAVHYESEGYGDPTPPQIADDLAYLDANYGGQATFHRIQGRPVVFVFTQRKDPDGCETARRWKQGNPGRRWYVIIRKFDGYRSCGAQPDAWYDYRSGTPQVDHPYQFSIAPGYWKKGETPLLARNPARWRRNIRNMIKSCRTWQLVTTYNEWGEGTAVESATEWASDSGHGTYMDALHRVHIRPRPDRPLKPCIRRAQ